VTRTYLSTWPADTDLIFLPGSNKVMITVQRPVVRAVIQDAIERTRANLMIANAFPNVFDTLEYIRDALVVAAEGNDQAEDICRRLMYDNEYNSLMSRLPRARIPLFRRDVKDCCASIIQAEFLAIGSAEAVSQLAQKQLADYNYTFPKAANNNPLKYLPMRTRPYRNIRIANVIRDLFFLGGNSSFATRFRDDFPIHQGSNGVVAREVPIAMVALVATALYAAIQEWQSGIHRPVEFSTNAYIDVYNGHINTFVHIRSKREESFHNMMSEIYSQAIVAVIESSTAIADVEFDEMDV